MPLNLFISYAQVDRPFRDELANHLSSLRRGEVIRDWFDGDVTAGSEREQAVRQKLQRAHLILLLVSALMLRRRRHRRERSQRYSDEEYEEEEEQDDTSDL